MKEEEDEGEIVERVRTQEVEEGGIEERVKSKVE